METITIIVEDEYMGDVLRVAARVSPMVLDRSLYPGDMLEETVNRARRELRKGIEERKNKPLEGKLP